MKKIMRKITAFLIVSPLLFSAFVMFPSNVDAIGQHEGNDGTVTGETEPLQNKTYYFDGHSVLHQWETGPNLMNDSNPNTWANTSTSGDEQLLNSNNCTGAVYGTIKYVKLRAYGTYDGGGLHNVIFQPRYGGNVGDTYEFSMPNLVWSSWQDITNDSLFNGIWSWNNISNLGCYVEANITGGDNVYCGRVDIRVWYTEEFNVTRTVEETGDRHEKNNFSFTPTLNNSDTNGIVLKVPVSSNVYSILNVTNNTCGTQASSVSGKGSLVNNTYYFDSLNDFIYIGTINLTTSTTVNWTINCSYNISISLVIPQYLEVGDYFHSTGFIEDGDGSAVDNFIAETKVLYLNGTEALSINPKWNCKNGNYQCTFSTHSLIPGVYYVNIEFIDATVYNITLIKNATLYLSYDTPGNIYSDAVIFFNFYNTNEGLGLPRETLKIYVNDSRLYETIYYTYTGAKLNITVRDYYNTTLYSANHTINSTRTFLDLGLTFHSWLFGNMNEEYYMISILKQGGSRWWERGIVPYGEREFLIPSGTYAMRIYDADYNEIYNSSLPASLSVINSRVYVIHGTNLSEIISGQSVIRGQLLEVREELDYALMPDAIIWSTNPPIIISCFDRIGMMLGQDIWKVCPALNVIATTRNGTFGNWINSTVLMPSNGTVENGTITLLEDSLYIFGNGSVDWVNITYTDNRTVKMNVSYVPGVLRVFGENLTINASGDIQVYRETIYNQLKKFYWDIYNSTTNPGHIADRAGFHRAGIEVSNSLNTTLYNVYVFAGFSDKTIPDVNTVQVQDVENGALLEKGENYKTTADGVDFRLTGSVNGSNLNASSSRNFVLSYYRDFSDSYIYDDGQVYRRSFESDKIYGNKVPFYNYVNAMYTNTHEFTFRGGIFVIFDFADQLQGALDVDSIIVHDEDNSYEVGRENYVPGESFVLILSDAVGDTSPGSSRTFGIYFLESLYPGADPTELHFNTEIWNAWGLPVTPLFIVFIICLAPIVSGVGYMIWDRKRKPSKAALAVITLSFVILVICWVLASKGY